MVRPFENRCWPRCILDDHGRRDEKAIWGEQAMWCDYSGWVDEMLAGTMIMPDQRNAAACRWHVRDYGLMVANPFGQSVFQKGAAKKALVGASNHSPVPSGQPLHLRFGILLHAFKSESDFGPAAAYQDYLSLYAGTPATAIGG